MSSSADGDEEVWVFLTAGFVCLCVIYILIFQVYGGPASPTLDTALPYQVLFRDLPGGEQRTFRAMQEGATEAVRLRGREGAWPSVAALAAAGIPPFAPDALDRTGLQWSRRQDGLVTNYLGVASGDEFPAFLILLVEPAPGAGEQPVPAVVDEEHQLLADGTLVHVTYWKRVGAPAPPGVVADPALQGWSQIRVSSPFQNLEAS